MKKDKVIAVVGAFIVSAATVVGVSQRGDELCLVRPAGAPVGTCQCQGNEMVPRRSPANRADYPAWGDCGGFPRPARLMRGDSCVPAVCP